MKPPVKPSSNIRSMIGEEGAVLRNTKTGVTFALNPVAGSIWKLLQEGKPVEAIVAQIGQLYDAPASIIAADVRGFVQQLQDCELVIPDDPSSNANK